MFSGWMAIPVAVFSIVSVLGCTSTDTKLEPLASYVEIEPPKERKLKDLPVLHLEEKPKKSRPEKLYTLSVRDARIQDVLLSFSRESKKNIIVDPDVDGMVTVDLRDVTLDQAMDALLTPLSLEYSRESGFIRVSKPKMMTRLFHLNYIITSRFGSRGLSSNITGGVGQQRGGGGGITGGGVVGGGVAGGGVAGGGIAGGGAFGGGVGSSVSGVDIQDIFQELELGLTALGLRSQGQFSGGIAGLGGIGGFGGVGGVGGTGGVGAGVAQLGAPEEVDKGRFSINRQAGIILINTYPDLMAKAAELIEAVEGTIQRQVLIRAKIVEVTLDDEYNYGINWDMVFNLRGKNRPGGDTALAQGGTAARSLVSGGVLVRDIANFGDFSQFTIGTGDLQLVIDALNEQGEVNVISSPKVSTLNNQTAIIRASTEETFFSTETTFIETSPGVRTPQTTITKDRRDIGVTLDVTPQISSSGVITMNIHPAVTELAGTREFTSGDQKATAPVLTVRETDTVVRVGDGETIVIGGLMKDKKTVTEQRFPLFWRIPGVGKIFSSKKEEIDKTDLAIFLTPTVLLGERVEDYSIEEMERLEMVTRY
ncbi:MAG: secretin and TonB N-terminal domain-containing protein [Candidatus Brocadiales bacterium]